MKIKCKIILIVLIILILLVIATALFMNYLNNEKLKKCLEPTGRPMHTGLKNIDDCYHDCCDKQGEERTQCFDFCYSLD